jgi:hypothetical protein
LCFIILITLSQFVRLNFLSKFCVSLGLCVSLSDIFHGMPHWEFSIWFSTKTLRLSFRYVMSINRNQYVWYLPHIFEIIHFVSGWISDSLFESEQIVVCWGQWSRNPMP